MPVFIQYILKISICITLLYIFYQLVLNRLTLYNWKRWYFLIFSTITLFIPLINISTDLSETVFFNDSIIQVIPSVTSSASTEVLVGSTKYSLSNIITIWNIIMTIIVLGYLFFIGRLMMQYLSYLSIKNNSCLLSKHPIKIYLTEKDIIPFTFGILYSYQAV